MHVEARTQPIEKIVVHVNVGNEVEGGAQSLARYLQTTDAGYHQIADDKQLVTCARDDQVVWGASGMNARGLHICLIGQANQSGAEWLDAYSRGELEVAAQAVAGWCKAHQIPVWRLSPAQVHTNGIVGICGHVDVTAAFGGQNAGHWDPGPEFPWTPFLQRVLALTHPVAPPPVVWKVKPMYDPPLKLAAVLKNADGSVQGGVSPDGHIFAWGNPLHDRFHENETDNQPFGHPYFAGKQAAQLLAWDAKTDARPRDHDGVYTVVTVDGSRYSY